MMRNSTLESALIVKLTPVLAMEYTSTDNVEKPLPVTKKVTAKSSSEYVKARKNPAKILG